MIEMDIALPRAGFTLQAKLSLPQGVTAIAGPSGAGKTSLLRVVAGLEPKATGQLQLDGRVLMSGKQSVPPEQRGLGVVFQDSRLFPHLDVRANLLFAAKSERGLAEIADLLDLTPLLSRRIHALSGGEARRVALGRAVLSTPRLLLLDEPLTGLDGPRRARIMSHIEALIDQTGLSVLLVSHAWDEVLRLADHLVVMQAGTPRHHGPASTVFADPVFAREIGPGEARSLLSGPVVETGDELIAMGLGEHRLWLSSPGEIERGQRLRVAVMARDVTLALTPPQQISTRSILPVTIERIDPGRTMMVRCRLADQPLLAELTANAVNELQLSPGKTAYALIKATPFARAFDTN